MRSSAAAEDGSEASFAGQFETILNVRGEQSFTSAVARCWASVSGERVDPYRSRSGRTDRAALVMAVLVQRLIPARVAGVAFSVNPLTSELRETPIDPIDLDGERWLVTLR